MKTLIVYDEAPETLVTLDQMSPLRFFLADGDRSALNGCYLNTEHSKKFSAEVRQEVGDGAQNEHWTEVKMPLRLELQQQEIIVVHCGILL